MDDARAIDRRLTLSLIGAAMVLPACRAKVPPMPGEEEGTHTRIDRPRADRVLRVAATPMFATLLRRVEGLYEDLNPRIDLLPSIVAPSSEWDAGEMLSRQISAGAPYDVTILEDTLDASRLSVTPMRRVDWLGNELAVVTATRSRLRLADLSVGSCEVAMGLAQSPLGVKTRAALERRGIWSGVSRRVGWFNSSEAILERITDRRTFDDAVGVVYASSARTARSAVRMLGILELPDDKLPIHPALAWTTAGMGFVEWLRTEAPTAAARELGFRTFDVVVTPATASAP